MNSERLSKFIGKENITIVEAMGKIDQNAHGILFVVNDEDKLTGTLSDGDIRRWIMNSGELTSHISNAMNKKPIWLNSFEKDDAVRVMKDNSINVIPILDNNSLVIDIAILSEFENHKEVKRSLADVPVVVMAGGKGTRLYPYTKILPKPLIPIGDTPIVERIMDYYTEYGIKKFYMTVNYKMSIIRSYFEDINPDYSIKYVEESKPLGTGGSIKLIEDKFDRPIFVTNCDALVLADYYDIYQYHISAGNDVTMVSALKNIQVPYGVLHTGDNGSLESIEEKPRLSYFINTGMYIINPEIINLIPDNVMFHMTHLIEVVMKKGGKVGTYPVSEDSFLDMGEIDEMKRMEEKLHIVSK